MRCRPSAPTRVRRRFTSFRYFADRQIFCAGRVEEPDLVRVCKATGGAVQTSVNNLTPEIVGKCDLMEEVRFSLRPRGPPASGSRSGTAVVARAYRCKYAAATPRHTASCSAWRPAGLWSTLEWPVPPDKSIERAQPLDVVATAVFYPCRRRCLAKRARVHGCVCSTQAVCADATDRPTAAGPSGE